MDFKKVDRDNKRAPKLRVPERSMSRSITTHHVASHENDTPSRKSSRLPRMKLPSKTAVISFVHRSLVTKKGIVASILVAAVVGSVAVEAVVRQYNVAKKSDSNTNQSAAVEKIEFQTVLPTGKSISELGGWKRISPTGKDPVFAYADKIGDVSISVSEQPLPKSFKGNVDEQVADLAEKFNATTKNDAGNTKVYTGTSAKGPQSTILTKNGLLILIKSQKKIDIAAWTQYVKSLN